MAKLNEKLSEVEAGSVLDVATRDGAFVGRLSKQLPRYDEIVGIDITDAGFQKAQKKFADDPRIRFQVMDGCATNFSDGAFDLVCLSNSLHHIPEIPSLLKEMKRIKKEDGLILISEMPADGQEGASLTHAMIHELDCLVDTYKGAYHHRTYSRQEIIDFVKAAGLDIVDVFEDTEDIPSKNAAIEERVEKALHKIEACQEAADYEAMKALAGKIQEQFNHHGARTAMQYIIFAK